MSLFIAVLKCIFCVEDDEDREIRHQQLRHSSPRHSYHLDRDGKHDSESRSDVPLKSQANFGQTTSSLRADYGLYPSQTKSTNVLSRETIIKSSAPVHLSRYEAVKSVDRDAVSGSYAPKQPSVANRENIAKSLASIKLSGNRIVNSINSSPVSGNNKDASVASQSALASSRPLKPPSVTSKPSLSSVSEKPSEISQKVKSLSSSSALASSSPLTPTSVTSKPSLSSVSEKPSEISQKVKSLSSSSATGNIHRWEDANKGTNSTNDGRHSSNVPPSASKQFQSSTRFSFSSEYSDSSSSTNEAGKSRSAAKTDEQFSSSSSQKSQSPKPPPLSTKPTISAAPSSSSSPQSKTTYIWVEKDASSTYVFPKEIKSLIEKDIVPGVLKMPLSKSSYKDYFHALLYAEDCYLEKWDGFEMKNVKVQLHEAAIYTRRGKNRNLNEDDDKDEKVFVAFELDKIREKRPFLISRDFVSLQPSNSKIKKFQGVIYRVVKSNLVLAEFGEDFQSHHHPNEIYDVKFSFNRVCLKRAHQAVAAASESLFRNFLFPSVPPKRELLPTELLPGYKYQQEVFAVRQISRLQDAFPYVMEGPLAVDNTTKQLSKTGRVVVEAILRIFRADPSKKILLCAPVNRTCDLLMRGLKKEMAESDMFRANAAFREVDGVPIDILPSCLYTKEMKCFSCPSLKELKKYKVILTTFMSSFRLYGEGIMAGHFSHIFLVDASSTTEPEAIVPLANFVTDTTIVVVTGALGNRSRWVRSTIARENGLVTSYFERLCDSDMYEELGPKVMVHLEDLRERYE